VKRVKRTNRGRNLRYRELLDRIARTNDTGLSDETVLAILNADRGAWSEAMTVEELFASMGLEMPYAGMNGVDEVSPPSERD
jgi:hypothetical protein